MSKKTGVGLVSTLRTMSLPDVLQWIAAGQKTGVLKVKRRRVEKRLLFENGVIHSSWSDDPRESLRQFLMREGLVSESQIVKAFAEQERQGKGQRTLYGSILVSQGLLDEEDLRCELWHKAAESIYDLFLWPDGEIEFVEGPIAEDSFVHIEMKVEALILEGIRRVDEWARIREVFPSRRTTFEVLHVPGDATDAERELLTLVSRGRSLEQLALETRRSEFETAELLHSLHSRGAIAVGRAGHDTVPPKDTDEEVEQHLDAADEALADGNFDAALKMYQDILLLRPHNSRAELGIAALEAARADELALADLSLSSVPVLKGELTSLGAQKLDATEGFVLSRINGEWDVGSILKVCPMTEDEALLILARFLKQGMIELR